MVLVILGVAFVCAILGHVLYHNSPRDSFREWLGNGMAPAGWGVTVAALAAAVILGIVTSGLSVIDEKIDMYTEENTKIETQIAKVVEQYQEYETNIFTEVTPESSITLVSLYPELTSDELVKTQIEVYTENNARIKELREQKISGSIVRWWLYFGK